ncbi:hypothetical protein IMX12_13300 [Streptomyces sp. Babs14]|uniref:hypothetical protein n=1 Tax=unclassified Streptomyces TaxID=2593676 RepID=UPI001C24C7D3|nr:MULTISPECIES: hypothetical protein [unclassified Streptomyces]MBU8549785.1 hypothetical protein [Streptomyces sp. Osf17]MBU8556568.1 hypothetical protein [Streptomyces sp. Babs14]
MTKWTRAVRARIGYWTGCLVLAAGAGIEFGPGAGLIAAGLLTAGSCLLLVETDEDDDGRTR